MRGRRQCGVAVPPVFQSLRFHGSGGSIAQRAVHRNEESHAESKFDVANVWLSHWTLLTTSSGLSLFLGGLLLHSGLLDCLLLGGLLARSCLCCSLLHCLLLGR